MRGATLAQRLGVFWALVVLALAVQLALSHSGKSVVAEATQLRLPLRVAYAGDADSVYSQEMVAFLRRHLGAVRVVPRDSLLAEHLRGMDLLLVDGEIYDKRSDGSLVGRRQIAALEFDGIQHIPTVLMGAVGGRVGEQLRLKTSWWSG